MSEFKGTPGPWAIDEGGDVYAESGRNDGQLGIVAGVAGAEWCAEDGANAKLIAAAPELLKELEETHAALCFTPDYIGSLRYERNKAAISKALGQ